MPRRVLEGKVVSDLNDKTVTVLVERRFMHPVYKKYVKKSSKYRAHDEVNHYKSGDKVSIIECPPLSKTKRWVVMIDGKPGLLSSVNTDEKKPVAKKAPAKKAPAKKLEAKKETAEAKKPAAKKANAKKAPAKKTATKKETTKK